MTIPIPTLFMRHRARHKRMTDCWENSPQAGGLKTEIRDLVHYAVPGGWLADFLFARRDVRRIFEFRVRKLRELFP